MYKKMKKKKKKKKKEEEEEKKNCRSDTWKYVFSINSTASRINETDVRNMWELNKDIQFSVEQCEHF